MHHDVTDPVLAVIGTLFAILLGFMLANSMQRFEGARSNLEQEAGAVGDIYRLVDGLPADIKSKTRRDCVNYTQSVVNEEWALMQNGKSSDKAWASMNDIWHDCLHFQPNTQAEGDIHQMLVAAVSKAGECRRTRFAELKYGLPQTLWFIVIFGGLSTIGLTYFFAVTSFKLQVLMTSVITMIVGLNIYMLAGYDAPFSGDIALTAAPFESALEVMTKTSKLTDAEPPPALESPQKK